MQHLYGGNSSPLSLNNYATVATLFWTSPRDFIISSVGFVYQQRTGNPNDNKLVPNSAVLHYDTLHLARHNNTNQMANISNDLKSYLSGGATKPDNSSSTSYSPLTSWFSKKEDCKTSESNPTSSESDPSNGWFNEAQKDPLCPSLVKLFLMFSVSFIYILVYREGGSTPLPGLWQY